MNVQDTFTSDRDALSRTLADTLAQVPELLAVGWLDHGNDRAVWQHRDAADHDAESSARHHAQALPRIGTLIGAPRSIPLSGGRTLVLAPMPFATAEAVAGISRAAADVAARALTTAANNVLRGRIGALMAAGLPARRDEFPTTDTEFVEVLRALRALPSDDLIGRLSVGGFADRPVGSGENRMRCQECIYFLPNRKWCDLPELPLPVEPDWYCRLWKL